MKGFLKFGMRIIANTRVKGMLKKKTVGESTV